MNTKRWVRHISGQGEKWEVLMEYEGEYRVQARYRPHEWHSLPKSEYILCDPPEEWRDVTEECDAIVNPLGKQQIWRGAQCLDGAEGYRFRKEIGSKIAEDQWAFIVEKKVST